MLKIKRPGTANPNSKEKIFNSNWLSNQEYSK